ncbi:MAG: hypothetical protein AAB601_01930 [Patescibacteria group bacterium]
MPTRLIGHDERMRSFTRLAAGDVLSHAYLFFGDRGVGKCTFAQAFAAFLERGTFAPDEAALLDATVLSPNERGTIGIDVVRELRHFLSQTPVVSRRRTAIIDDAESLTDDAQGALLKIVEEPPPHSLIIFVAFDPAALLPPLRSRLAAVYFPRLSRSLLTHALVDVWKVAPARAAAVAPQSFGRIGRALQLVLAARKKPSVHTLAEELEMSILALRATDRVANARNIGALLTRAALVRRYNVNEPLQRKAAHVFAGR